MIPTVASATLDYILNTFFEYENNKRYSYKMISPQMLIEDNVDTRRWQNLLAHQKVWTTCLEPLRIEQLRNLSTSR